MKPDFKKTRKFLEAIDSINLGGCGLAALALYDAAKREGKKPKIVYLYHAIMHHEARTKNDAYKRGKGKAYSCSHVLIKIGHRYWDSEGLVPKSRLGWYISDETITREHLVDSINNKDSWNEVFDRKLWMDDIKKFLKRGTKIAV